MTATVLWPSRSISESLLARAANSMGALRQLRTRPYRKMSAEDFLNAKRLRETDVVLELTRSEAFFDTFSVAGMSGGDLRKLLESEAGALSPTAVCETEIVPIPFETGQGYALLHLRTDLVRTLEKKARKLGIRSLTLSCEDAPDVWFEAPAFTQQARVSRKFMSVAFVLILSGLWSGLSTFADRREAVAEFALVREQSLRAAVIDRNEVSAEAAAFEQFAALDPAATSPQGVLSRLAELTRATPQSTWWSEVSLSATEITVSAISKDAGASLQDISRAYPDLPVRFTGAVSDLSEARHSFTIVIWEASGE